MTLSTSAPVLNQGAATGAVTVCPKCRRRAPAHTTVCRFCWSVLSGHVLTAEEVAALVAAEHAAVRREHWQRRSRWLRYPAIAALLTLLLYRVWLTPGGALPLPLSTARAIVPASAAAGTWPVGGGDVGATRATTAAAALDGAIAWRARLDSGATTALVADERAVYVGVANAALVALSADDGRELWRAAVPGQLDAPPTLAGDRLYMTLRDGSVAALDPGSGQVIWRAGSGPTFSSSPLVAAGTVYAAALGDARMYDAEDGRELWQHRIESLSSSASPVLGADALVTAVSDRALVFDRASGEQTFFFKLRAPAHLMVVGDAGIVVGRDLLVAFGLEQRRPWWEPLRQAWGQLYIFGMAPRPPAQPNRWLQTSVRGALAPALAGDVLVLVTPQGAVRAIDVATGEDRWTAEVTAVSAPPIATRDGVLLVGLDMLTLLDPATGGVLKQRRLEGERFQAATVTARGTYFVSGGGDVVALR